MAIRDWVRETGEDGIQLTAKGKGTIEGCEVWSASSGIAVNGKVATYLPASGFKGADTFTFAAFDGKVDSNLGTITVTVN